MGELSLDGSLRPIKGALPIAIQARKEKFKGIILPKANAREAAIVNDIKVYGVNSLQEAAHFLDGQLDPLRSRQPQQHSDSSEWLGHGLDSRDQSNGDFRPVHLIDLHFPFQTRSIEQAYSVPDADP